MYEEDSVTMECLLTDFLADLAAATPERLIAEMEQAREDSRDSDLLGGDDIAYINH